DLRPIGIVILDAAASADSVVHAELNRFRGEKDVSAGDQVEPAVSVQVHECRRRHAIIWTARSHTGFRGNIFEFAILDIGFWIARRGAGCVRLPGRYVVVEYALSVAGNVEVRVAVVVIIADRHAIEVAFRSQAGILRNVLETAVTKIT